MDSLPAYDNNPPGLVMFEPFLVPQPTLDLLGGVTLAGVQGAADQMIITHGVGRQRGRAYVSVRLTGVFADATGTLWKTVTAKQVPMETAIAGFPGHLWRFEGRLEEDMARERLREHQGYAARPWFTVVWAVFHRLDPAMDWAGHTRSAREKAWLTLARATAVAAGELRAFIPAWYSSPLDEAVRRLYPGCDCYESCARQWLCERPGAGHSARCGR